MSTNKKTYKQLGLMILITLVTQAIILLKTSFVASKLGVTVEMDAYNFSLSIGTFLFSFIGSGITTVLIPNLVANKSDKAINTFITLIYSIGFVLLVGVYILREPIISLISGRDPLFVEIASSVMLLTLLSQYLTAILGVFAAVFQCKEQFNTPKNIVLVLNLLLVIALAMTPNLTVHTYAFYLVLMGIGNLIVQGYFVSRTGFSFRTQFDLQDPDFKAMMVAFGPMVLSTGLYQVTLLTDTFISARLGTGQISILNYTNSIISMVNMMLVSNLTTYFYPKIAKDIQNSESQTRFFNYSIFLSAIMCLLVTGFLLVGKDGVTLLYERGNFDRSATDLVFLCAAVYILSLPTNAVRDLFYRYFYAKSDTLTPFKNSVMISIINMVISIILATQIGLVGVVLGTVISSYLSLTFISMRFKKKFSIKYSTKLLVTENLKIIGSSVITLLVVMGLMRVFSFEMPLLNLMVFGPLTVGCYAVLLFALKSSVFKLEL